MKKLILIAILAVFSLISFAQVDTTSVPDMTAGDISDFRTVLKIVEDSVRNDTSFVKVADVVAGTYYTSAQIDSLHKEIPYSTKTANYALQLTDAGTNVFMNSSDAATDTITIPVDVFSVKQWVNVIAIGTDSVRFVGASGAELTVPDTVLYGQGAASITYYSNDSTVTIIGKLD